MPSLVPTTHAPTIHPQFVEVLMLAHKLGMRTSVGTIGTMLAREDFGRRAVPYLDEALFSLHGPNAEVHDGLTRRPGSFDTVTAAMKQVRALNPDFGLYVNTVITRHNLARLPETAALANSLGASLIVVSNLTPEGLGLDNYEALAPPLEDLREILPKVPDAAPDAIVRFFGTPICVLGDHATLSNDLHWDPRVTVEWQSQPGKVLFDGIYSWAPDRKRVHVAQCQDCRFSDVCTGVFDRYAELFSTDVLRPPEGLAS